MLCYSSVNSPLTVKVLAAAAIVVDTLAVAPLTPHAV